jgi:hypothetical protein
LLLNGIGNILLSRDFLETFNIKKGVLGICLLSLFIFDFISKCSFYFVPYYQDLSSIIKFVFQIIIVVYILLKKDYFTLKKLSFLSILFAGFLLGHFFLKSNTPVIFRVLNNIKIFNWYLFIYIITAGLKSYLQNSTDRIQKQQQLFDAFELIFYINSLFIFLGFVFNIYIFLAYPNSNRFGFIGLLRNVTHTSYIYMIFITYFYYKYKVNKDKHNIILLLIAILICFLIATKALILFIILFIFYIIVANKLWHILIAFSVGIMALLYNIDVIIQNVLKPYFKVLYDVYIDKGLFTMLFSFRNESIDLLFIPYVKNHWKMGNLFFGGAEFNCFRTELELIDFVWFFGFLGTILYFYFWHKYIFSFRKIIMHKPYLIIFIISIVAGSFFSSVPVITFLAVLNLYLSNEDKVIKFN